MKSENKNLLPVKLEYKHLYDILFDVSFSHFDKDNKEWYANLNDKDKFVFNVGIKQGQPKNICDLINVIPNQYNATKDWFIVDSNTYEIIEIVKNTKPFYNNSRQNNEECKTLVSLHSGAKTSFVFNGNESKGIDMACLSSGLFEINYLVNNKLILLNQFIFPKVNNDKEKEFNLNILEKYERFNSSGEKLSYLNNMYEYFMNYDKYNEYSKLKTVKTFNHITEIMSNKLLRG